MRFIPRIGTVQETNFMRLLSVYLYQIFQLNTNELVNVLVSRCSKDCTLDWRQN